MEKKSPGAVAALFLKLGALGFGGPAAHIAMMEEEVVEKRKWLSREHFLDLMGATNLIPGPNSTEMAMHVGYSAAGLSGLVVAGVCFIVPAVLITSVVAWLYVSYGTLPEAAPFLAGIKPAVLAVIAGALWRLGRQATKDWRLLMVGIAVMAVSIRQGHEILALFGGGLLGMFWLRARGAAAAAVLLGLGGAQAAWASGAGGAAALSLGKLGLFFLKVGAVLYGSGYVLFAFLEGGLVEEYGWLSSAQLMDAVAVGQFTPGPVLSTATFIGYVLAGPAGAVVATVGIFLPSFFFVAVLNPLVPRLRQSAWMGAFLDAVNAAAVGLMAAVTFKLGREALVDAQAWWVAAAALLISLRWKVSAAWLVLGGGLVGVVGVLWRSGL